MSPLGPWSHLCVDLCCQRTKRQDAGAAGLTRPHTRPVWWHYRTDTNFCQPSTHRHMHQPSASCPLLFWRGPDHLGLFTKVHHTARILDLKLCFFSFVNLLQLVNMCILNLGEKNPGKLEKKKSLVLSRLDLSFWIFVCFVFYFCALIMN